MGTGAVRALALTIALLGCQAARAEDVPEPYDPDEALAQSLGYSLAVTGVGGLLLLAKPTFGATVLGLGLVITPSLGHFYADNWVQGALTASARLITATAAVVCLIGAAFPAKIDSDADPDAWTRERKVFLSVGLVAAAATVGLAAFDIATAPDAARRANAARAEARWRLRWSAWLAPQGGGLSLGAGF